MLQLPRFRGGQVLTATDLNMMIEAIERAFNIRVIGAASVMTGPTGVTITLAPSSVSTPPILVAKTVGRHDAGVSQNCNLYQEDAGGSLTQQFVGASDPKQVKCRNRLGNLAGDVVVYIVDISGDGTLYNIVAGNPCLQGNTGGPNA